MSNFVLRIWATGHCSAAFLPGHGPGLQKSRLRASSVSWRVGHMGGGDSGYWTSSARYSFSNLRLWNMEVPSDRRYSVWEESLHWCNLSSNKAEKVTHAPATITIPASTFLKVPTYLGWNWPLMAIVAPWTQSAAAIEEQSTIKRKSRHFNHGANNSVFNQPVNSRSSSQNYCKPQTLRSLVN